MNVSNDVEATFDFEGGKRGTIVLSTLITEAGFRKGTTEEKVVYLLHPTEPTVTK